MLMNVLVLFDEYHNKIMQLEQVLDKSGMIIRDGQLIYIPRSKQTAL